MIVYLRNEADRLTGFETGIAANSTKWANNEVTPAMVRTSIEGLTAKEKEIEDLKKVLNQKQLEARALQGDAVKLGDKIENYIRAFHSNEPEKLIDYGLEPQKSNAKKQAPTTKLLITVEDDSDGVGFVLTTQVDPDAELYEWYKGTGADATKPDVIPQMTLLKATKKISFVDDEVPKGVRIFYKVRATNYKGDGPWSEPVSRVQ